jgi:protein TonB
MGYQALLFCPDEKTARSVTKVLSELDFEVVSCNEPFDAVKRMMAAPFDAIVVDCDNEQNASLLFKSSRNTPNNQAALAVAVVEGQVGVAKAFRIGANLVLTKPINIEQAKGTLRVARGLLRKNETAKPALTATAATLKPAQSEPTVKPFPGVPVPADTKQTSTAPTPSTEAGKVEPKFETKIEPKSAPTLEPRTSFAAHASSTPLGSAETKETVGPVPPVPRTSFSTMHSTGAASAPAPARESKPSIATPDKSFQVVSKPQIQDEKNNGAFVENPIHDGKPQPAPALAETPKPASSGNKTWLIAFAAMIALGVLAYFGWTQFATAPKTSTISVPVRTTPAGPAAVLPAVAPASPADVIKPSGTTKASASAPNAAASEVHPAKVVAESPKPEVTVATKVPTASVSRPIIVKSSTRKTGSEDEVIPGITTMPSSSAGTLPNLGNSSESAIVPRLQTLNVSQGVSHGLLVKQVQPAYPPDALRLGIEGSVQLLATISKNGDISAVKVVNGNPSLSRAASDAVKKWKYKPYLLNGEPVEIQTQVTINFKVPR